jgi:fructokinase
MTVENNRSHDLAENSSAASPSRHFRRPVIFGEALFDHFPDGRKVLGGAPFNVAWHLQGFELDPLVISRVGADEAGREILARMSAWGMVTSGIQRDDVHSTGRVTVTLSEDGPSFEIEPRQAYDYIAADEARIAVSQNSLGLLYHGTLALREERSFRCLQALTPTGAGFTFCDVNLRDPWWTEELVAWSLANASWVKVNETELGVLAALPAVSREQCVDAASALADRHRLRNLIVTLGAEGAFVMSEASGIRWAEAVAVDAAADTVGAGDAFSAVFVAGVLHGWGADVTLERAVRFAADICGVRGATTDDRSLYRGHLASWSTDRTSAKEPERGG